MGKIKVLDLFSGVGGFSIGLEASGMETAAFCEVDEYCRRILRQHWPNVPIYNDVQELTGEKLKKDGINIDLICGGFPCQDISTAGKRLWLNGARSGLWREFARLVQEINPRWVLVENVSNLRALGLETVLADLASLGFDAEWHCIPAAAVGAPHRRDRIWILAHAKRCGRMESPILYQGMLPEPDAWTPATHHPFNEAFGARYFSVPPYLRVGDGVRIGLDEIGQRIKAMGNSIHPEIPKIIGQAINTIEQGSSFCCG